MEAEEELVLMGVVAGQAYSTQVQGKGANHNLGPPHVQISVPCIDHILKLEQPQPMQAIKEAVTEWWVRVKEPKSIEEVADWVRVWRLKTCYQKPDEPAKVRLTFMIMGAVFPAGEGGGGGGEGRGIS